MRSFRMAMWSLALGVLSVALAALLFRLAPAGGIVFVALLAVSVALLSFAAGMLVELPAAAGAGAGAFGALLVAVTLGLTIMAAPIAEGARRPELSDLLWSPLFGLLATIAVCAAAGWFGLRAGLRLARRSSEKR